MHDKVCKTLQPSATMLDCSGYVGARHEQVQQQGNGPKVELVAVGREEQVNGLRSRCRAG